MSLASTGVRRTVPETRSGFFAVVARSLKNRVRSALRGRRPSLAIDRATNLPDLLIAALREAEAQKDLPNLHFQELVLTVQRMARQEPWKSLPAAEEVARGEELAGMPPAERLIESLREVELGQGLPPAPFGELVQTVLWMAKRDGGRKLPGAAELVRGQELATYNPADLLIASLREAEQRKDLPSNHFEELVHTILRMAPEVPERVASLETALGGRQIAAGQDSIVRNLARTVIGERRFLVLDIGALDGWFIDRILAEPRDVHLVAFEPMPEMLPELAKRQKRWPMIEIRGEAVGDTVGTLPLRVYPAIPGLSSLLEFEPGYNYFKGHFEPEAFHTVEVPVITVDEHFRTHPELGEFDNVALKIDVQGFEDRVLRGAETLLASGRVKAVLIELVTRTKYAGSWDYLTLLRYLDRQGFVLYDVNPFYREIGMEFQPTGLGRLTEMDCLFVRADYLETLGVNS